MTLETRNSTLHDILSQTTPLSVARFQRHYEWTVKEMEQLLSDLAESLREARSERSNPGYYFLGSFIFHTPKGRNVQVVDGQQRLVSLSIVLAVARDLTQDPSAQKQIDSYLTIPANAISQAPATQRLNLHRGDDAFYKTHIVPVGATNGLPKERQDNESHERLRRNAMRARHWIGKELSEGERAAFIHHITSACRIVLMTVDDEDDAFRIFETVNNRGRPLHAEDILRVTLIEFATPSESKRAELLRKWDTVERRIGQKEMPQFIAQWRVRQLQGKHSNKPLHRAIVESYGSPDEALAFLDKELTTHADIFNEISAGISRDLAIPRRSRPSTSICDRWASSTSTTGCLSPCSSSSGTVMSPKRCLNVCGASTD
jgi:hypothetical protein